MSIVGVDGCKMGWVAIWKMEDGCVEVQRFSRIIDVLKLDPDLVVIDIPIGLVETGTRLADAQARALLKGRGCCVFNAPLRPMLKCSDHSSASILGKETHGIGISIQTWAIIPKIKEVDAAVTSALQAVVTEGHPEVSFAQMNGGMAIPFKKASAAGRAARLDLLAPHFPDVHTVVERYPGLREDIIDAYAMLWTGRRIRNGTALQLPEVSATDSRGLRMQIQV